ncbi:MAG: isocitrate lyase/phosphoenolpyruvate mutase family protein [Acidobacteriota bacterium]
MPGLSDLRTLETLAHRVEAPVNVMVGPGSPAVSELTDAGVRRISVGPAAILGAYGFLRQLTQELLRDGTYGKLADAAAPGYGDVDGLFRRSITPHDASPV